MFYKTTDTAKKIQFYLFYFAFFGVWEDQYQLKNTSNARIIDNVWKLETVILKNDTKY